MGELWVGVVRGGAQVVVKWVAAGRWLSEDIEVRMCIVGRDFRGFNKV